ncbi:MAG: hypothetical protein O7J95_19000 [Planctomycetota bacterium]|nr:hypothetical protein [Planctomycetota bacterium]
MSRRRKKRKAAERPSPRAAAPGDGPDAGLPEGRAPKGGTPQGRTPEGGAAEGGALGESPGGQSTRHRGTKRLRLGPILLALVIQGVFLYVCLRLAAAHTPLRLVASDLLVEPGTPVTLEARVEQDLPAVFRRSVGGSRAVFRVGEGSTTVELEATTDGAGRVIASWKAPTEAGNHPVSVSLELPGDDPALETAFVVHAVPAGHRLILTTVEETLARPVARTDSRGKTVLRRQPRRDAPGVLAELSESRTVVYLNATYVPRQEETRSWLEKNGFPAGPVVEIPLDWSDRASRRSALSNHLQRHILPGWKERIDWAVTLLVDEYWAFSDSGVRALLIGPSTLLGVNESFRRDNWKKAKSRLEQPAEE